MAEAAGRGGQGGFCYVLPSLMSWREAPLRLDLPIPTEPGLPSQRAVLGQRHRAHPAGETSRDLVLVLRRQEGGSSRGKRLCREEMEGERSKGDPGDEERALRWAARHRDRCCFRAGRQESGPKRTGCHWR